jgi:hypothetical protein
MPCSRRFPQGRSSRRMCPIPAASQAHSHTASTTCARRRRHSQHRPSSSSLRRQGTDRAYFPHPSR